MLKRYTHLIAAAAAVLIAATPAAQAGDRYGRNHHGRDGARQVQSHHNYQRTWNARRGWQRTVRVDHYRPRYAPRPWPHRVYRYAYHAGPRIVWRPRHRHHDYWGWHADRYYNLAVLFSVLNTVQTGYTQRWQDPDLQVSGSVTPTRTYTLASGQYCREYQQEIVVDGRPVSGFGRACRQPDGSWETVN